MGNQVCELLHCELPIQLAPMGSVSATPSLPLAVAQAGGHGMYPALGLPPAALEPVLDALAERTRALPVGAAVDVRAGLGALLSQATTLFLLGLRFAAPVVAASMIGNVALAVLSRVAPQLNALTVAFPLQIALGLVATSAGLAFVATFMTGWGTAYAGELGRVFSALAHR